MKRMKLTIIVATCVALPCLISQRASADEPRGKATGASSSSAPAQATAGNKTTIAMLIYPEFTALDLVGPLQVLAALPGYQVQLVWKTKDLITSDSGLSVKPTMTFKECPEELAVLFVPGGMA